MPIANLIRAEIIKTASLRGFWVGLVAALLPVGTFALMLHQARIYPDVGPLTTADILNFVYQHLNLAAVPTLVIGAVVGGAEFARTDDTRGGANGWTATLLAAPNRLSVLLAKLAVLIPLCAAGFFVAISGILAYTHGVDGFALTPALLSEPGRLFASGCWLICVGLIGFSVVVAVGSVPIPLTVMILNFSTISPVALLAKTGFWVRFAPDLAAGGLTFPAVMAENELFTEATRHSLAHDVALNWAVVCTWTLVALALAWWRIAKTEVSS